MDKRLLDAERDLRLDPSPENLLRMLKIKQRLGFLTKKQKRLIEVSASLGSPVAKALVGKNVKSLEILEAIGKLQKAEQIDLAVYCANIAYRLFIKRAEGDQKRSAERLMSLINEWPDKRKFSKSAKERISSKTQMFWHDYTYNSNIAIRYSGEAIYQTGRVIGESFNKKQRTSVVRNAVTYLFTARRKEASGIKDFILDFLLGEILKT